MKKICPRECSLGWGREQQQELSSNEKFSIDIPTSIQTDLTSPIWRRKANTVRFYQPHNAEWTKDGEPSHMNKDWLRILSIFIYKFKHEHTYPYIPLAGYVFSLYLYKVQA